MNKELKRWQNANVRGMSLEAFDREIRRRLRRRALKAAIETAGMIAFLLLAIATIVLYLVATPDQMSGEYDLAVEEAKAAGF